jgi:hypothetical protein
MQFDLKDVLSSVGPAASLIFAAWIFLTLLNSRYMAAFDMYRSLVSEYRDKQQERPDDQRWRSVREQIRLYKKRCEMMRFALTLGLIAAMLLITSVITGAIQIAFTQIGFLKPVSLGSLVVGLTLVIAAAIVVLRENIAIQGAIDSELTDLPDLHSSLKTHRSEDRLHRATT